MEKIRLAKKGTDTGAILPYRVLGIANIIRSDLYGFGLKSKFHILLAANIDRIIKYKCFDITLGSAVILILINDFPSIHLHYAELAQSR